MTVRRGKNLDIETVGIIEGLLDGWSGKLSWELLILAIAEHTGSTYTRQALHRHPRVLTAFQVRKTHLSRQKTESERTPESLSTQEVGVLLARTARLEAENARLQDQNDKLLAQFCIWAYNAHVRGIDKAALDSPLPEIDRELSFAEKKRRNKLAAKSKKSI